MSITVIGEVIDKGVLLRSGGKPEDRILVTGALGGSILHHQFFFEPRINEALHLNRHYEVHSAIDISDGLTLDLHRLAEESHVGATLYESKIPISQDARKLSQQSGRSPLDHALSDGEDFEILFSVPPHEAERLMTLQPFQSTSGVILYDIGKLTAEKGLRMVSANGTIKPLIPSGFEH